MRHMRVHLVSFNSIYYVHTFYEDPSYIVLPEAMQQTSSKVLIYLLLQNFSHINLLCVFTLRDKLFYKKQSLFNLKLYCLFRFIVLILMRYLEVQFKIILSKSLHYSKCIQQSTVLVLNVKLAFSILHYIKKDKYLYLVMRMLVNNMLLSYYNI